MHPTILLPSSLDLQPKEPHRGIRCGSASEPPPLQRRAEHRSRRRRAPTSTCSRCTRSRQSAKNKLVVVECAASHSPDSQKMYPFMVELSRTCGDVEFLLVMGDESEEMRELCRREGFSKVPHFSFYKAMEKVHDEEAIGSDQIVEALMAEHTAGWKLLVLRSILGSRRPISLAHVFIGGRSLEA